MLIEWNPGAREDNRARVRTALVAGGARFVEVPRGLVVVEKAGRWIETLRQDRAVLAITPLPTPYKLASRLVRPEGTLVEAGGVAIGGREVVMIAGPCSVETEAQMLGSARGVRAAGARMLRAGAYKPRTSPWTFQGLGAPGLELLRRAAEATGLATVTEVVSVAEVELVATHADMLQIGARNAQNYPLLDALGRTDRPVLLKRGPSMTLEELLLSAERVMAAGNPRVVLCERGLRSWEPTTRNLLDLASVAALKRMTHLPVLVDPSHGVGRRDLVPALARAAVAVGADGVLVEAHPSPDESWTDAAQAIDLDTLAALGRTLSLESALLGRTFATPAVDDEQGLDRHRARIDALDAALVQLLDLRMRTAMALGEGKRLLGHPVRAVERERSVLEGIARAAISTSDPSAVVRAFEHVVRETRQAQEVAANAAEA